MKVANNPLNYGGDMSLPVTSATSFERVDAAHLYKSTNDFHKALINYNNQVEKKLKDTDKFFELIRSIDLVKDKSLPSSSVEKNSKT